MMYAFFWLVITNEMHGGVQVIPYHDGSACAKAAVDLRKMTSYILAECVAGK